MSLKKHKQDWEELAELDPCWAILSDPARRYGRWDLDEFFLTGHEEMAGVMEAAVRLGYPIARTRALDFGCGIGRLTQALAEHFHQSTGVDISETMIARARELNRSRPNCEFRVNIADDLRFFPDGHFDLVYSRLVLQHLPQRSTIRSYISEFLRVLQPGGLLIFQLPSHLSWRGRLQRHRRQYSLLRALGFRHEFLYRRMGLCPMRMNFVPEREVLGLLRALGATILEVEADGSAGLWAESRTYYVTI